MGGVVLTVKFNVDEEEYLELVDNLCNTIKKLRKPKLQKVYFKHTTVVLNL